MSIVHKAVFALSMMVSMAAQASPIDITLINKSEIQINAFFDMPQGKQVKVKLMPGNTETTSVNESDLQKIQIHPKSDKVRGNYIFPHDFKEKHTFTFTINGADIVVTPS